MKIDDKFALVNHLMCGAGNESNNPEEDILQPPASRGSFLTQTRLSLADFCEPNPSHPFLPRPAPDHLHEALPLTSLYVLISSLHRVLVPWQPELM